jgi:uncharacterized protein involved in exopolysaccharide biosynthesis
MIESTNFSNQDFSNNSDYSDLFDWLIAFGEKKHILLFTILTTTILSLLYSLYIPSTFTAKSIIVPPTQQQQNTSVNAVISSISNLGGLGAIQKSQEEFYISLLQSDTLQNEVIKVLKLQELLNLSLMIDVRQQLKGQVRFTSDKKSGFIIIEADNIDPKFAAVLANTFVDELRNLQGKISYSNAQQRVLYYERAIAKTQSDLKIAKTKFQNANVSSGVISSSSQTESIYSQIATKELQISALSNFSTSQHSDIRHLEADIKALRQQLFNTNKNITKDSENPSQQLAIDSYREIKSLEFILSALTSQFKASVLDIVSSEPFIQVIQPAYPPERRSKPQKTLIVLFSLLFGIVLGIFITFISIIINNFINNTHHNENIKNVINSWTSIYRKRKTYS